MLLVNLKKVRYRDAHLVRTPDKLRLLQIEVLCVTLTLLVKLYRLVYRVRNLRELLFVHVVNKLFLLQLDLVDLVDPSWGQLGRLNDQGCDKLPHRVLLLVCDDGAHMRAPLYLVGLQRRVCIKLICADRPIIKQQQHAIQSDCED